MVLCFQQKTAYEMRISDGSSDVCASDLRFGPPDLDVATHAIEEDGVGDAILILDGGVHGETAAFVEIHFLDSAEPPFQFQIGIVIAASGARFAGQFLEDRKSTRLNSSH